MRSIIAALAFAATAVCAHADVIYHNGVPQGGQTTISDFDFPHQIADDFQLEAGSNRLTDIHWWGAYRRTDTPGTDAFTVRIFTDVAGQPSAAPLVEYTGVSGNRFDTGEDLGISDIDLYGYSLDIAPVLLAPNTTYWLSIVNDTSNDTDDDWAWASNTIAAGNTQVRDTDVTAWAHYEAGGDLPNGVELAFYLIGGSPIVPEPASMTLLAIGLVSATLRIRRR